MVKSFDLLQNYPNPFNPSTNIVFNLASASNVKAVVYNMFGQQVSVVANGIYNSGTHVIQFDGAKYASGVYVCKVQSGNNVKSIKMVLTK
jgi:flagellar hook assembly protein FlgD